LDHRILSISPVTSLQTSVGKPCNRVKFEWKKPEDPVTKEWFQIELTNRVEVLQCNESTLPISERYESFEQTVKDVTENVVGIYKSHGMPSSDRIADERGSYSSTCKIIYNLSSKHKS